MEFPTPLQCPLRLPPTALHHTQNWSPPSSSQEHDFPRSVSFGRYPILYTCPSNSCNLVRYARGRSHLQAYWMISVLPYASLVGSRQVSTKFQKYSVVRDLCCPKREVTHDFDVVD
ncbi:hypothetical protein QBC45DRAFT_422235 [Copromyces sp. CBS 386.78]|nr:hypothetical protein QBC45DRAFT_422235 [Copromyces sp. CBS 386.78]